MGTGVWVEGDMGNGAVERRAWLVLGKTGTEGSLGLIPEEHMDNLLLNSAFTIRKMSQCDSPEEGKVQVLPDPTSGGVVLCWYPRVLATDHERQRPPSPCLVFLKPCSTSLILKKDA